MTEFLEFINASGLMNIGWQNLIMLAVGTAFIILAIRKNMEPYELLPIGLGILVVNLPFTGLSTEPTASSRHQDAGILGVIFYYGLSFWNIIPPIIFLGLGAMTDFTSIIANPKTLLLGAAAQIGIFLAFWGALTVHLIPGITGFTVEEAAAIGIIGGADGPTTIFLSAKLAPHLLGITAVIAYSYMASVTFIQPPLMKLLTTKKERIIEMKPPREVSQLEKLIFPPLAMLLIILVVPRSAPLISMFMIGNMFRESGVVPRLANTASNELINFATIFLMLTVGAQLTAQRVFNLESILILVLGWVAFSAGTVSGIIFAKFMNIFMKEKIHPLIGSAGVSAVPMAARISHHIGQESNPKSFLLPHALGPNVAGVIGSAVVAGVFSSLLG